MSDVRTEKTRAAADLAPGAAVRPTTVAEAADCLRDTTGTVLFRGGGTKLGWAGGVARPDLVLSTERLSGLLAHNAADMTVAVQAGTPLAELQAELAGDGQWLALDPPTEAGGATIGGLLAAGDSGPVRLRYGNLRDLVIGVTLVLADGTVAHSGGHVIKNVAGYDLAKLLHGSLGSLALVAEVVLRLHPRPAVSVTTVGRADASQAAAAAARLAAGVLEPTAVEWAQDGESGELLVRIDGSPRAVEVSLHQTEALLAEVGVTATACPAADLPARWARHAAAVSGAVDDTVLRLATLPTDLLAVARHLEQVTADGVRVNLVSSAALGVHTVRLTDAEPAVIADAVARIRSHALGLGGSALLRNRPGAVDAVVDPLGPAPAAVDLLRRVKAQFDPAGRCAPGRFGSWY